MFLGIFFLSKIFAALGIALLVATGRVSACEGECIVGITDALLSNYTAVIHSVVSQMEGNLIVHLGLPKTNGPAIYYFDPIIEEYNRRSYDYMEGAIFKTYFHGKCQDSITGIEPSGCPNPSCPVVCGTPGSIVYHFGTFRYRAFDATVGLFNTIANRNSPAYKQVVNRVVSALSSNLPRRRLFRFKRSETPEHGLLENIELPMEGRDSQVETAVHANLHLFRSVLSRECGGTPSGKENGLPNCSWEQAFKEYILSFP